MTEPTSKLSEECNQRIAADDFQGLLQLDPGSPFLLTAMGDLCLQENNAAGAVDYYRSALERFPEYVAAHFALAMTYRRLRMPEETVRHLREALVNAPLFYGGSFWAETWLPGNSMRNDWRRKSLLWLQQSSRKRSSDDPFIAAANDLQFQNGVKESADFPILERLITQYIDRSEPLEAIKVWMLYGHRAAEETISFRERLHLTPRLYGERFAELLDIAGLHRRAQLVRNMVTRLHAPEGHYL